MCGRFAIGVSADELPSQFHQTALLNQNNLNQISDHLYQSGDQQIDTTTIGNFEKSYNVAPSNLAIIAYLSGSTFILESLRFGLIPPWAKPKDNPNKEIMTFHGRYFNCRKDTLAKSQSVWTQSRQSRCVVPMQGYFEWHRNDKTPYFVHSKSSKLIYFAGLYSHNDHFGKKMSTFAIVTGPAEPSDKGDLSWLHLRKPLMLKPGTKEWNDWLNPGKKWGDDVLEDLKVDSDIWEDLTAYTVSKDVGKTSSRGEYLIEEVKVKKERDIMLFFGKRERKGNEQGKLKKEQGKLKKEQEELKKEQEELKKPVNPLKKEQEELEKPVFETEVKEESIEPKIKIKQELEEEQEKPKDKLDNLEFESSRKRQKTH